MGKFIVRCINTGVKFDLKAANGEVIASSEVYTTERACRKGISASVVPQSVAKRITVREPRGYIGMCVRRDRPNSGIEIRQGRAQL